MDVSVWHIEGYRGFEPYKGKEDDNVCLDKAFDASFSKDEVVKMLCQSMFSKNSYKETFIRDLSLKKIYTIPS